MPITQFPAGVSVTNINGANGFSISGFPSSSWGGAAVSGVGDINGDGIADLAMGAPQGFSQAGVGYVVFGKSGIGSSAAFDVASLTGTNGFVINGFPSGFDNGGTSISGAGDINNDGIADLVIGSRGVSGASYVIFGKVGVGITGSVNVTRLTGANGFVINGFISGSNGGAPVSGAGDINADGVADLAIGAVEAFDTGAVYVIFGKSGLGSSGSFSVASLTGTNGFLISGFPLASTGGTALNKAGDINDDGVVDLVIGAPQVSGTTGEAYVIFGKSGIGNSGSFSVASLNGANGFVINGFPSSGQGGYSANGVGDINADGIADLVVGAPFTGTCYVMFGKNGIASSGSVNVASLTGTTGFAITGFPPYTAGGESISGADINGDGISDLLIGGGGSTSATGASYVIFGQSGIGSSGMFSIPSLTGVNGFVITGFPSDTGGSPVSGAGDVNHDGIPDLIVGNYQAFGDTGITYVIFGEQSASLIQNNLIVKEGQSVVLNSQYLNATNSQQVAKDGTLLFSLNNIQHGRFFSTANVNTTLTSFTQQQIRSSEIQFAQDGSGWAPAYNVSLSYPGKFRTTSSLAATITFEQSYILVNNNLTINQAETVILSSSDLSANDLYNSVNNPNLIFSVSNVQQGYFALVSSPTLPMTVFTQAQVQSGSIQFVHNGSPNSPSYSVSLINGATSLTAEAASIAFDIPPTLTANTLTINQGQIVVLSASNLNASDPYTSSFTFTLSNVQHGYFALVSNPTTAINSFTQAQIQNASVQFVQDGTATPPSYSVSVSDGRMASTIQAASISFDATPTLLANTLTINQGQTVILSSSDLSAADPYDIASNLIFMINNVQSGFFALLSSPAAAITSFTQAQVQNGNVQFVHDGSDNPPSYSVLVTDGRATSAAQTPSISFDIPPNIATNTLTINQGQTIILNPNNLSAFDPYTSSFTFTLSNIQHGYFAVVSSPTTPVTSFTQVQIQNGMIQFVHDGTSNPPSYNVSVSDGRMSSTTQASSISFDTMPVIINNRLNVNQGQTVVVTSSDLSATNPYNSAATLTFTVSNVQHGNFALISSAALAITSFTQTKIQSDAVQFVQDGTANVPSYSVSVSDGLITTVPQLSTISFHIAPVLVQNSLMINQGQTIVITSNTLSATSGAVNDSSLIFTVSQVQHGFFELISNPDVAIGNFTQAQIQAGQVQFVDDGSDKAPSYSVIVSDGQVSMVGSSQSPSITFNAIPVLVANQLSVTQGQTIVLSNNDLSATDQEVAPANLLFTATALQHGHFEDLNLPGVATTEFVQQRVMSGGIKFVTDGSIYSPAYNISVSDGNLYSPSAPAVVNFIPSSETTVVSSGNTNTVRNAIIGGTISGFLGLLFLGLKLWLTQRSATNLKKVLADTEEIELDVEQTIYPKEVIRVIAKKVFERINTINFLGYRSEINALAYVEAIKSIILNMGQLGINLKLKDLNPMERSVLINEIAKQVRSVAVGKQRICSKTTVYNFFKPEITPDQIQKKSKAIALAVQSALSTNQNELEVTMTPKLKTLSFD